MEFRLGVQLGNLRLIPSVTAVKPRGINDRLIWFLELFEGQPGELQIEFAGAPARFECLPITLKCPYEIGPAFQDFSLEEVRILDVRIAAEAFVDKLQGRG